MFSGVPGGLGLRGSRTLNAGPRPVGSHQPHGLLLGENEARRCSMAVAGTEGWLDRMSDKRTQMPALRRRAEEVAGPG